MTASAAGATSTSSSAAVGPKRFYRTKDDKKLGGVCGGIARYLNVDPLVVRIITFVLALTGAGLLAYILFWIFAPEQ
jgi:phage shock protein C